MKKTSSNPGTPDPALRRPKIQSLRDGLCGGPQPKKFVRIIKKAPPLASLATTSSLCSLVRPYSLMGLGRVRSVANCVVPSKTWSVERYTSRARTSKSATAFTTARVASTFNSLAIAGFSSQASTFVSAAA